MAKGVIRTQRRMCSSRGVKIDLTTREAIEIIGTISDRDVERAERLVARNADRLKGEWIRIDGND